MLNGLDLFSGIGGMSIALQQWVRPLAYCENDRYCQSILLNNIHDNLITSAPIWDDIRSLPTCMFSEIDIIYGGFPCQDISVAGHGKGLDGERSGLYWEIHRLAKEIIPKFIFIENVPAICTKGGWDVVSSLASLGYDCRWCVISAASVGACHRRERWFCLARHTDNKLQYNRQIEEVSWNKQIADTSGICEPVAHSSSERSQTGGQPLRPAKKFPAFTGKIKCDSWDKEPENKLELAGMADGLSCRSHRIKCLGNAVVPIQAKTAFETLMGLMDAFH